jgi:hypothetical protein
MICRTADPRQAAANDPAKLAGIVMSMSESRANYAATLDSVINDQEEVVITRSKRGRPSERPESQVIASALLDRHCSVSP